MEFPSEEINQNSNNNTESKSTPDVPNQNIEEMIKEKENSINEIEQINNNKNNIVDKDKRKNLPEDKIKFKNYMEIPFEFDQLSTSEANEIVNKMDLTEKEEKGIPLNTFISKYTVIPNKSGNFVNSLYKIN